MRNIRKKLVYENGLFFNRSSFNDYYISRALLYFNYNSKIYDINLGQIS